MRRTDIANTLKYQCDVLRVVEVRWWIRHANVPACRSPETDSILRHKHRPEMLGHTGDTEQIRGMHVRHDLRITKIQG